jgi:single-strand DNA-binding protein
MSDNIYLTGVVGTVPRSLVTGEGLSITSFRLASSQRKFDRAENKWVNGETNWFTVTSFRLLANNVANSIHLGDHVVASGRLRVRSWENGEKSGISVELEAEAVGHDLSFGVSQFARTLMPRPQATGSPVDEYTVSADEGVNGVPLLDSDAPPEGLGEEPESNAETSDAEGSSVSMEFHPKPGKVSVPF